MFAGLMVSTHGADGRNRGSIPGEELFVFRKIRQVFPESFITDTVLRVSVMRE